MVKSKRILSLVCLLALLVGVVLTTPGLAAEEEPQWVEKAPMALGKYGCGAEAINGKIYILGGAIRIEGLVQIVDDVEIYDPVSDSWSTGTPMPTPRAYPKTAVIDGKIHAIGGVKDKYQNFHEIYDPVTDSWETAAPMLSTRRDFSAVSMAGKIYIISGYDENAQTNSMDVYDPVTNTWINGTPLPVAIMNPAAVALQDKIYLFGGVTGKSISNEMYIYDLETDTWEKGPNLPIKVDRHTVNLVGDQIYLLGGNTGDSISSKVFIFDPTTSNWSYGPDIKPRYLHAAAVIEQTIYAIGGYTGSETINQMEALTVSPTPSLRKLSVYLNPAETVQLSVSDTLSDNLNYTWTSSTASVATVDTNGKVTAVAPGLSTLTATNAEGISQNILVRVLPGTADLFRLAVHLTPGQTQQLGMSVDQEEVSWTWQSLDESVATVDAAGKVSAVAPGLAIVQATLGNEVQQIYVRVK